METKRKIIAKNLNQKTRLDSFLTIELNTSKNQINTIIKDSLVSINNKIENKNGYMLRDGDVIEIDIRKDDEKKEIAVLPKDARFDIEVLYENDDFMILNKPPFLVVHAAPSVKEPTLVDWLKIHGYSLSTLGGKERHGIIHRIDKQTSGALCIAKNNQAHAMLSDMLRDKSMGRIYLAIIDLALKDNLIIESQIARNPSNRLKMKSYPKDSMLDNTRYAKSEFVNLAVGKDSKTTLIAIKLSTGRTHQIRTQLESINRHILGDTLYGYKNASNIAPKRIFLHAYMMYIPYKNDLMNFCAPIFRDMVEFLDINFSKDVYECIKNDKILASFSI